jgi:hypothetical protein
LGARRHARLDFGERFGRGPVGVRGHGGREAGNPVACDLDLPKGRIEGVGSWSIYAFCLLKILYNRDRPATLFAVRVRAGGCRAGEIPDGESIGFRDLGLFE